MKKLISVVLCFSMLGCATIHRHPRAIAIISGVVVGGVVGGVLGHQSSCRSSYNGVPYNGTPPCPIECYSPGKCEWPGGKKH